MACKNDGGGSFLGFTVTINNQCSSSAADLVAPQALVRQASDLVTVASLIKPIQTFEEWLLSVDQFEAPDVENGPGILETVRFGSTLRHAEQPISFHWPWESAFNLGLLVGSTGTLRNTNPDASYWEDTAKCVSGSGQPNRQAGVDSIGNVIFRWLGGKRPDQMYTAPP